METRLADRATGTGLSVQEKRVPVSAPEGEIAVRVYTPEGGEAGETFPVLFDMHGTCSTSWSTHRALLKRE